MTPPAFAGHYDKKQSASSASTLGADFFCCSVRCYRMTGVRYNLKLEAYRLAHNELQLEDFG